MTAGGASALYVGKVAHQRYRPRAHKLSYRIYSLLLDLDEIDSLDKRLRLFSFDRGNLFAFYGRDRGVKTARALKGHIEGMLTDAGLAPDGGAIRLLTMPRVCGWAFNPLSVFFCHRRTGELAAIFWQVDNTFGQRHGYLIPVASDAGETIRQSCDKAFYVSPFMDMELRYDFRVAPPSDTLALVIDASDAAGLVLRARQTGRRVELTDADLLKAFFALPLLTLRVVAGIHWEALKLWLKGVGLRHRPPPPAAPISIIRTVSRDTETIIS